MSMLKSVKWNQLGVLSVFCLLVIPAIPGIWERDDPTAVVSKSASDSVRYSRVVAPVLHRYCMPCHSEDEENPSGLSMDTYDDLIKGGKHGAAVVAGKPDESPLIGKLSPNPPFGDPMPLRSKKRIPADTVELIRKWILQGAWNR
jgi:hypothetical protein